MKQTLVPLILLVCFLHAARANRPLKDINQQENVKVSGFSQMGHSGEGEDDAWTLLEACGNEDEECLKRRMISEAHLDYIYTQHHKP
ncbi:hypothetical protein H6P81_003631 [Aristolochia fimbriata]|uniref:Phytosulfokine n=1 Tax=Aristolochia fimbriata TaxID=158543 RepID=A0AAV7FHA3_ARIFI|nr:hypothetical protein H6P81_003631 [Aristolochia fimbriata]